MFDLVAHLTPHQRFYLGWLILGVLTAVCSIRFHRWNMNRMIRKEYEKQRRELGIDP